MNGIGLRQLALSNDNPGFGRSQDDKDFTKKGTHPDYDDQALFGGDVAA
jgi:hypothetical protein